MHDNSYFEYGNGFRGLYSLLKGTLEPVLKTPKATLLYTLNRNWKDICGEKYADFMAIEKVILLNNQKTANLCVVSSNSSTSFFINNNKSYILDKINNCFGYRAIVNLYIKEVPKATQKITVDYVIDEEKLSKYHGVNISDNIPLRNQLNELAIEVYKKKIDRAKI
jgi:hypothetical protein